MKVKDIRLTHEQVGQILKSYPGGIPDLPSGWEFTGNILSGNNELSGKSWVGSSGQILRHNPACKYTANPVLEVTEAPKRYRFICDDPTPRLARNQEWVALRSYTSVILSAVEFVVVDDVRLYPSPCLVFRREEVVD